MKNSENNASDVDFGWDDDISFDFGGEVIEVPGESKEDVKPDEKESKVEDSKETDTEEKETKDEKPVVETVEEDQFDFGETEDSVEDEEETQEVDEFKGLSKHNKAIKLLEKKGIVSFDFEEDSELSDADAEDALEMAFQNSIDKGIQEVISELPESVRNLIKYTIDGGDHMKYIQDNFRNSNPQSITEDLDMASEQAQVLVMQDSLRRLGYDDDEEIANHIAILKETGKLEKEARKKFERIKKQIEVQKEKTLKEQELARKQAIQNRKQLKKGVKTFITNNKEVKGLTFNSADKSELPEYMTDPSIKTEDGRSITPMHRDLHMALQDESKAILIAKLLKSDFDFSEFEKKAKTKVTKEVKKNLTRSKPIKPNRQGGSRELADFF